MICSRSYELTRKDKLYKNIQRMQHSKVICAFGYLLKINDIIKCSFSSKHINDLLLFTFTNIITSIITLCYVLFQLRIRSTFCPKTWYLFLYLVLQQEIAQWSTMHFIFVNFLDPAWFGFFLATQFKKYFCCSEFHSFLLF